MTSENEVPATGAQVTNFIRNIIDDDLARGANLPRYWCGHPAPYSEQFAFVRAFRQNRMAIFISVTLRVFV